LSNNLLSVVATSHPHTFMKSLILERDIQGPFSVTAKPIGHSGAVPTVHQDNNRKARIPLHSTSHLELAAKDSSGQ